MLLSQPSDDSNITCVHRDSKVANAKVESPEKSGKKKDEKIEQMQEIIDKNKEKHVEWDGKRKTSCARSHTWKQLPLTKKMKQYTVIKMNV